MAREIALPESLRWLMTDPVGAEWIKELPEILAEVGAAWHLEDVGEPFPGSNVSLVVSAVQHGRPVVLKLQWPHEECRYEADALAIWDGDGAVRLLANDRKRHALLLEPCVPGTHLSMAQDVDVIGILIDLLPRLWKPVDAPFKTLADEAGGWASRIVDNWEAGGRPIERAVVEQARDWLLDLKDTQGEQVLVHQDLHGDNILSSEGTWLAIDPKPLRGEREFALAPIIRSFEFGGTQKQVVGRLDRLTSSLGLDRERSRRWAIAQTLAWGFGGDYTPQHMQTVRWLMAA